MCIPLIPAVGIGLSLAGAAGDMYNSQVTYEYQRDIAAQNAELARGAAVAQYSQIGEHTYQELTRTQAEAMRISGDALAARGRVTAAAAEAGVGGNSVDALLEDYSRQEGNYLTALKTQERFTLVDAEFQKKGVQTGLQARLINSAPPARPNLFGQALGAFSSAFNTGLQLDQVSYSHGGPTLFI